MVAVVPTDLRLFECIVCIRQHRRCCFSQFSRINLNAIFFEVCIKNFYGTSTRINYGNFASFHTSLWYLNGISDEFTVNSSLRDTFNRQQLTAAAVKKKTVIKTCAGQLPMCLTCFRREHGATPLFTRSHCKSGFMSPHCVLFL